MHLWNMESKFVIRESVDDTKAIVLSIDKTFRIKKKYEVPYLATFLNIQRNEKYIKG